MSTPDTNLAPALVTRLDDTRIYVDGWGGRTHLRIGTTGAAAWADLEPDETLALITQLTATIDDGATQ